jgi:hypothetical protein
MTNHAHLVAIPTRPDSLSGGVGGAHRRYTGYFYRRYRRSGHLWQTRFYSCAVERYQHGPTVGRGRVSAATKFGNRTKLGWTAPPARPASQSLRGYGIKWKLEAVKKSIPAKITY